jgi:oxygen-dependent protoporphyrinogen oxidase
MKTILGGGISSLAAAYYLAKKMAKERNSSPIKLIYAGHLGGWIRSFYQNDILYETGPRSLRPMGDAGYSTLELIADLKLSDQVVRVNGDSPAAKNRYVYFEGKLHNIPSNPVQMLQSTSPVLSGLFQSILKEPFRPKGIYDDESIGSFVDRRLGHHITENLVSAIIHGVYAGDVYQLSAKSTLSTLWNAEQRGGSIVTGMLQNVFLKGNKRFVPESEEAKRFIESMANTRLYSFRNGMQTLVDRLVEQLKAMGVEFINGNCTKLSFEQEGVVVSSENGADILSSHVFSGIPAWELAKLLPVGNGFSEISTSLRRVPAVDVGVVNLTYHGSQLPHQGFGFLVPKSQTDQCDVIGVVYDSCVFPEQDKMPVTRLTVMMGGHMFNQKFGSPRAVSRDLLLDVSLKEVEKVLGIPPSQLMDSCVSIQEQCIPQYVVGHHHNMTLLQEQVNTLGRLSLMGASYHGVSVNDCIYNARKLMQSYEI